MAIKDCLNTMKRFGNMKCRFGVAFAVGLSFVHLKAENVVFADFEQRIERIDLRQRDERVGICLHTEKDL